MTIRVSFRSVFCTLICLLLVGLLLGCASFRPETPRLCPVHELSLERELVVVRTGTPRLEYERARREAFPYPGVAFSHGQAPSNLQEMAQVPVCGACRRAERTWVRENRW